MNINKIRTGKLKNYITFLYHNHLDDFTKSDLERAVQLDVPLIKLFSHLPEEKQFEIFKNGLIEFFQQFIDGKEVEGSFQLVENLKNDKIPGLPKDKLDIRDIALSYNVRKHSIIKYIPSYTSDINEALEIVKEAEDFFTHRQSLIYELFTQIHTEKLRTSEQNFKSLAEASFEGIVIHKEAVILEANQTIADMLGYTREEMIGLDIRSFSPPELREMLMEKVRSNYEKPYEAIGIKKDGSLFPIELMGRQILFKNEWVRVVGIRDISERKKQQEIHENYYKELEELNKQLNKEKEFNQIVIDNANSMIIAFDREMNITAWNKKLEETGLKKEDVLGRNYYDIFPEFKGWDDWFHKVWEGRTVTVKDKPFKRRKGYFDAEIVPLFNENNEIYGALCYSREVTQRKLAEERLKEQEYFISSVAEASPSMIYVFDLEKDTMVYGNHALLDFFGLKEGDLQHLKSAYYASLFHPDDFTILDKMTKAFQKADEKQSFYVEYRNRCSNGEYKWLATTMKVFKRNEEGKPKQILGITIDINEQKLIEETLEEKTKIFQTILDSIPVMVFWKDDKNIFLGFNKAYREAVNYSPEELLHKNVNDLFPDGEKYLKDDHEVINSGQPKLNIIESVETSNGIFYSRTDKVPLRNLQGEIIGVIGSALDVTELKRTQEELSRLNNELEKRVEERTKNLQQREQQYRFLADFVPQIFWTADETGKVDYYNQNWYKFTGLDETTSLGDGWQLIIHPDDLQDTINTWTLAVKTGEPYQVQSRYLRHADKTYRWHLGRAQCLRDENGKIIKWFGTSTDIHDQKSLEESLKMQAEVIENMDEGVCIVDQQGYIIYVNQAQERIFGYEHGELVGKQVTVLNAGAEYQTLDNVRYIMEEVMQKNFWAGEWNNIKKDGTCFTTYSYITFLKLEQKELFVCVQRDITEEKKFRETILKQNEELIKINNDLDNFIYTASHDLKAPVSNIEGLMLDMMSSVDERTKASEDFNMITNLMFQSVERFKNTIRDLTDISKAQKGVTEDNMQISVADMVEEVKQLIATDIKNSNAEIIVDLSGCQYITFSLKNFRSIVYNLLINAIKYRSPERKPVIQLSTFLEDQYCVLQITDNGLGMQPGYENKIFQMFKRMHSHVDGSGVGLYIVKRMLDNAGGKIEVKSVENQGTTFKIHFKTERIDIN